MAIDKITGPVCVYLDGVLIGQGLVANCPSELTAKERSWRKRWRRRLKRWCQFEDEDIREVNAVMKEIERRTPGATLGYYRRLACAWVRFEAAIDMWLYRHYVEGKI